MMSSQSCKVNMFIIKLYIRNINDITIYFNKAKPF